VLAALPAELLASLARGGGDSADPGPAALASVLAQAGIGPDGSLPEEAAGLTALIEALPPAIVEQALIGLLASLVDPAAR